MRVMTPERDEERVLILNELRKLRLRLQGFRAYSPEANAVADVIGKIEAGHHREVPA